MAKDQTKASANTKPKEAAKSDPEVFDKVNTAETTDQDSGKDAADETTDQQQAGKNSAKTVPGIFVRSKRKQSRWRAGIEFNQEGQRIAVDSLTKEQLAAIKHDPVLSVESCVIEQAAE